jgi:hypothetical protein
MVDAEALWSIDKFRDKCFPSQNHWWSHMQCFVLGRTLLPATLSTDFRVGAELAYVRDWNALPKLTFITIKLDNVFVHPTNNLFRAVSTLLLSSSRFVYFSKERDVMEDRV